MENVSKCHSWSSLPNNLFIPYTEYKIYKQIPMWSWNSDPYGDLPFSSTPADWKKEMHCSVLQEIRVTKYINPLQKQKSTALVETSNDHDIQMDQILNHL